MRVLFAILLAALPATGQDLARFATDWPAERIALYAAPTADYVTTRIAIERYGYVETNPILGQGRARQAALIFGSTVGVDLLSTFLGREAHPSWVQWVGRGMRWFKIGNHGTAAYLNMLLIAEGPNPHRVVPFLTRSSTDLRPSPSCPNTLDCLPRSFPGGE